MYKTVVLNVVGLSERILGPHTPWLNSWLKQGNKSYVKPQIPAVTCTMQSTYLTGKRPDEHGIVGNGWYFEEECEVKFWRQSNRLVQAPKIWEKAKAHDPQFTCANLFWWYNMYSSVDYSVTPRPNYLADGRKIPDVYTQPSGLREELQQELGPFPLFEFWGPNTTINSSKWIAEAAKLTDRKHDPTLTMIYLPHLDYCLQKFGHQDERSYKDIQQIDSICEDLITFYQDQKARVILLSEYGITPVNRPVALNRVLRKKGWIQIREERGLELLDSGASAAFAVSDHQIAHVYVKNKSNIPQVKELLTQTPGVSEVWDKQDQKNEHLNHSRSGDLVVVAKPDSWFTYYYWEDDSKAPDFARTVDIHRKPGYDPVEMFANPRIKWLKPLIGWKLLKKKLGFRTLMNVIPLDSQLISGSHGIVPKSTADWPLLATQGFHSGESMTAPEVHDVIWQVLSKG